MITQKRIKYLRRKKLTNKYANSLWNPVRCISAGSPREVDTSPGPVARASEDVTGAETGHVKGDPGTACPLKRTESVWGAASTGLKFTWTKNSDIARSTNGNETFLGLKIAYVYGFTNEP